MGACHTFYDELRFDVRDPHQTHVYAYIRCQGDCPHFIQGWHHKAFPATRSTKEIFDSMWSGSNEDDPMMWPLKAPPSDERNRTLDETVKAVCDLATGVSMQTGDAALTLWEAARQLEGMKTP